MFDWETSWLRISHLVSIFYIQKREDCINQVDHAGQNCHGSHPEGSVFALSNKSHYVLRPVKLSKQQCSTFKFIGCYINIVHRIIQNFEEILLIITRSRLICPHWVPPTNIWSLILKVFKLLKKRIFYPLPTSKEELFIIFFF